MYLIIALWFLWNQAVVIVRPDKLPVDEAQGALQTICNRHLKQVVAILNVEWVIGVGAFAEIESKRNFI